MQRRGMFRFLGISGHKRELSPELEQHGGFNFFHVSNNAAHRGAETEMFPYIHKTDFVTYTAARWGSFVNQRFMIVSFYIFVPFSLFPFYNLSFEIYTVFKIP